MGEEGGPVAFDMLIEPDAGAGLGHDRCKRGLADLKRIAPQVVAVQFDQVEGEEEYALVSAVVADEIELTPATASVKLTVGTFPDHDVRHFMRRSYDGTSARKAAKR
jgi:hypothetical protein